MKMEKVLIFACLTWASLTFNACYAQNPEQYLPTFNIARDKEVTVNATCGGDLGGQTETYCKLVGYDSFFVKSSNQILSGQVNIPSGLCQAGNALGICICGCRCSSGSQTSGCT